MAEAALQDLYQCSVCLDTLKDPVTIPCGHNYCQNCISGCWNQAAQTGVYSCPQCREKFSPRPALKKNNVLAELIAQIKIAEDASAGLCFAEPGDVECDFCTERKLKAVKSCLVCLASFCETHVQPHYKSPAFKKHDLIEASAHLQEKICSNHGRLLEMFCRTDQTCICMLCATNDHKGHDMISTAAEVTAKKTTVEKVKKKTLEQIRERERNLMHLRHDVTSHEDSTNRSVKHSVKIFSELLKFISLKGTEVNEMIRGQQGAAVSQAEPVIKCLEQEIAELKKQQDDLEQLSREEDHVQFLQSFKTVHPTLKVTPSRTVNSSLSCNDPSASLTFLEQEVKNLCQYMAKITTRFKEILNEARNDGGASAEENNCPICTDEFTNKEKLSCGHAFCKDCLRRSVESLGPSCPVCKKVFGKIEGDQPYGTMRHCIQKSPLPGFKRCDTIVINYHIPSGTQSHKHPKPGRPFHGADRTAYLPDNKEGREVLALLKRAFDQKLVFTVGTSRTSGVDDIVTWNDIHHKTSTHGGLQNFGYPDDDYLNRVKDELKAKGVE